MTTENKRLIRVRTDKGAVFKRDGFGKKRQLSDSWRKPRGQHNKQREQKKAKGALPKPGFGSPVAVRGMHPSGFFEVLVSTLKDLEGIDAKTHAVRISAGVGAKKRIVLQQKAIEAGLKVLNTRVIKEPVKKEKPAEPAKEKSEKAAKAEPAIKKEKSPKAADAKKGGEKKTAKTATPSKSQETPVKKAADKPEAKAAKAPVKDAEKATKKPAAKPKAESVKDKPAAETKTQPKKKTSSGVKKNE